MNKPFNHLFSISVTSLINIFYNNDDSSKSNNITPDIIHYTLSIIGKINLKNNKLKWIWHTA
jgi:hypothetical protein